MWGKFSAAQETQKAVLLETCRSCLYPFYYTKVSLFPKSRVPSLIEIIVLNLCSKQVLRKLRSRVYLILTQNRMSQFTVGWSHLRHLTSDMLSMLLLDLLPANIYFVIYGYRQGNSEPFSHLGLTLILPSDFIKGASIAPH